MDNKFKIMAVKYGHLQVFNISEIGIPYIKIVKTKCILIYVAPRILLLREKFHFKFWEKAFLIFF